MSIPVAILASGRGSNFAAVVDAIRRRELDAEVVALVCDQEGAPVLELAKTSGVRAIVVPVEKSGDEPESRRMRHEEALLRELEPLGARFVILAGYMRIMTPVLIEAFRSERGYSRIVNIHPSLLPAFPGIGAYAQAFRYGAKQTGATVHLVEPEVDGGPICAQEAFDISDCRSEREVEERGLEVEHRLYPRSLGWILPERFSLEARSGQEKGRFSVRPN